MEAKALILNDNFGDDKSGVWECTACLSPWRTKETAEQCCSLPMCNACDKSVHPGSSKCEGCHNKDRLARERGLFDAAHKVSYIDYDLPYIFWEAAGVTGQFFATKLELENYCVDRNIPPPQWVWGVEGMGFLLDAEAILAHYQHQTGYNVRDLVDDTEVEKLQDVIDRWAMDCEVRSFAPDYTMAVVLDPDFYKSLSLEGSGSDVDVQEQEETEEGSDNEDDSDD